MPKRQMLVGGNDDGGCAFADGRALQRSQDQRNVVDWKWEITRS
jgi:hypothetical protein